MGNKNTMSRRCYIMGILRKDDSLIDMQLYILNYYRIYLHITLLSDITTSGGQKIIAVAC
eukprot:10734676-Ditylum_brightwellii.AAC.1